jgi:tetratricopeptide (TPR) repeat protein
LGVEADALLKRGQHAAGVEALEEAFVVLGRTGERFWEAELHRLKGEFRVAESDSSAVQEAEQAFRKALEIARIQGAALLVLRAVVSLGRLLCRSGRHTEARRMLMDARKDIAGPTLPDMIEAELLLLESGSRTASASSPDC